METQETEVQETVEDFTSEVATMLVQAAEAPVEAQAEETEATTPEEAPDVSDELTLEVPELPEDLAEELAMAEIDLSEPDPEPEVETSDDWYDDGSEVAKLQKELAKAKKREKYLEEQHVKTGSKVWRADAEKYFPYSIGALDQIQAKSKRDYLRQAKAIHDQFAPTMKMVKDGYAKAIAKKEEQIRAEVRAEMEQAWGVPTVIQGGGEPAPASSARDKIQSVRKQRSLAETIKDRMGR